MFQSHTVCRRVTPSRCFDPVYRTQIKQQCLMQPTPLGYTSCLNLPCSTSCKGSAQPAAEVKCLVHCVLVYGTPPDDLQPVHASIHAAKHYCTCVSGFNWSDHPASPGPSFVTPPLLPSYLPHKHPHANKKSTNIHTQLSVLNVN